MHYLTARVSSKRVEEGTRLLRQSKASLNLIGDHYGVDSRYLMAFWVLESGYGKHQGTYHVILSLATGLPRFASTYPQDRPRELAVARWTN